MPTGSPACIAVFLLFTVTPSIADSAELFTLEGLRFPCPKCQVTPSGECEVTINGEQLLTSCAKAVTFLLEDVERDGYDGSYPTPAELRSFLLRGKATSPQAELALRLLVATDGGQKALENNAATFLNMYQAELEELIKKGLGTPQLWLRFWQLPDVEGIPVSVHMKAVIVSHHTQLGVTDILANLSIVDVEEDRRMLKEYESAFTELQSPLADVISGIYQRMTACMSVAERNSFGSACHRDSFKTLSPSEAIYLQRLQMHLAVSALRANRLNPDAALQLLSETAYEEYRTPATHIELGRVIQQLINAPRGQQRKNALNSSVITMLQVFARHDEQIAKDAATLAAIGAYEAIELGETEVGLELLDSSIAIYGGNLPERSAFLSGLSKDKRIIISPAYVLRARELSERIQVSQNAFASTTVLICGIIAIVIGVSSLVFAAYTHHRRLARTAVPEWILTTEERSELRQILNSFGLPGFAKEDDLTKAFRVRAKELHPDTGEGRTEEFTTLTEKYKRAKELIARKPV